MRVPGEAGQIIGRVLVPEIIEQEERIEVPGLAEAEGALELHPGTLDGGRGLNDLSDRAERHRFLGLMCGATDDRGHYVNNRSRGWFPTGLTRDA
jgi:hypothetical protein